MPASSANRVRWNGRRRGWYEVWFATFGDPGGKRAYWVRYTIRAPRDPREPGDAAVWFIRFDRTAGSRIVAAKEVVSLREFRAAREGAFRVEIGDGRLRDGRMSGRVGRTAWDVAFAPAPRVHDPIPASLRALGVARTVLRVPHPGVRVSGWVDVDGRRERVEGAWGCQSHIWGRGYGAGWRWGHAGGLEGLPGGWVEALSSRLRVGGWTTPDLTSLRLEYGGARVGADGVRALLRATSASDGAGCWRLAQEGRGVRAEIVFRCDPADLAGVVYTGPSGERRYCYNTGLATMEAELTTRVRGGGRTLHGSFRAPIASYEFTTEEPVPGLTIHLGPDAGLRRG